MTDEKAEALAAILGICDKLDEEERGRVLLAACVFYEVDPPDAIQRGQQ